MRFLILALLFVSTTTMATFVPEHLIDYSSLKEGVSQSSKEEVDQVIKRLNEIYSPIVKEHRGKLSLKNKWSDDKIYARATQVWRSWKVEVSGGLARRPELTTDGLALIICHELGHHLAGFPFYPSPTPFQRTWAATEGQSDYFATQSCAKKLWENEAAINSEYAEKVPEIVRAKCQRSYRSAPKANLCMRINHAVESMIQTMANLMQRPMPAFDTPDPNVVDKIVLKHPAVQCRLDTSFEGTLCNAPWKDELIPGKKLRNGRDNNLNQEKEAATVSCMKRSGSTKGLRPACWFYERSEEE